MQGMINQAAAQQTSYGPIPTAQFSGTQPSRSPVEAALHTLNVQLAGLEMNLNGLSDALSPVCVPAPVAPPGENSALAGCLIENEVYAITERVNVMTERVKHMMASLRV